MLLNCVFFIDYSPKIKRQRNILNFLRKIPRTESSVEEATEIATDDIHPSLMNKADATSASDMSTVNTVSPADQTDATATSDKCIATTVSPGDQTDAAASLPDCWNTMQYENFLKNMMDWLLVTRNLVVIIVPNVTL